MPTYQYECSTCGHHFDIRQSIMDKKLKRCSQCHKDTLHRLIGTGSGIIFKGSGFYETDYKKQCPSLKAKSGSSGCDSSCCSSCKDE